MQRSRGFGQPSKREGEETILRSVTVMLTLAAVAVLVVAPAVESKTVTCTSGQVCKGTNAADWIFGSPGNDNIRPMGGNDYVCVRKWRSRSGGP